MLDVVRLIKEIVQIKGTLALYIECRHFMGTKLPLPLYGLTYTIAYSHFSCKQIKASKLTNPKLQRPFDGEEVLQNRVWYWCLH